MHTPETSLSQFLQKRVPLIDILLHQPDKAVPFQPDPFRTAQILHKGHIPNRPPRALGLPRTLLHLLLLLLPPALFLLPGPHHLQSLAQTLLLEVPQILIRLFFEVVGEGGHTQIAFFEGYALLSESLRILNRLIVETARMWISFFLCALALYSTLSDGALEGGLAGGGFLGEELGWGWGG